MTGAVTSRGRIDKREAILQAAFTVFARRGYEQACVEEIAGTAGVAKPTIYNHFTDKATLFLSAAEAAADAVRDQCLAAVEPLRDPGDDPAGTFNSVARALLSVCCSDRAWALRRLTYGSGTDFPELIESVHDRIAGRLADALADRLARLMLTGKLRSCDPGLAAEQFLALLTGPMEHHSGLGTRAVPAAGAAAIANAAVDTFLRAHRPDA